MTRIPKNGLSHRIAVFFFLILSLTAGTVRAQETTPTPAPSPTPAPTATPLAGEATLENVRLESEMVAYKALSEAAARISNEIKTKAVREEVEAGKTNQVSAENIAIYDAQVVKDWRFYRALRPAFEGHTIDIKNQYKALLYQNPRIKTDTAQEASGDMPAQAKSAASDGSAEPACVEKVVEGSEKPQCISDKVKSLRLGWARRFARGLQYDLEVNEQPGTVLVDVEGESETFTRPIRNPQSYLHKHTFTFKFGELFPEGLSMFKRGSEYLKKNPQAADPGKELSELLCGDKPLITCLTKGGSWWKRALMGTSVNLTLAQRAEVVSQVFVTDPRFGKDFHVHGGFVFDPAKLFPTATNWKGTFDDVKGIDKALALLGAGDVRGGRQPWKQPWAAAFIPKVEFKILSQFDFIKSGGELREARFPNRALNTLKFTWDVARAFPDTKSRLDADAIAEELVHLENNLGREEEPSQKWCILHLSKEDKAREVKNLHPGFSAASCQGLAKLKNAESYQLSCVKKGTQGGADERVDGPKSVSLNAPVPDTPTGNPCKW